MFSRPLPLLAAIATAPLFAGTARLETSRLAVELDTAYPGVTAYKLKSGGELRGAAAGDPAVELNGKTTACAITFSRTGADSGQYTIDFPSEKITATLTTTLGDGFVDFRLTQVQERGTARLKTLAFPGRPLLTLDGGATVSTVNSTGTNNIREQFEKPLSELRPDDSGNYFFASTDRVATGVMTNHFVDTKRVAWKVSDSPSGKTCAVFAPAFTWREIDAETVETPWVKVFITGDINGDGKTTWQDAAIVCRRTTPKPFGAEFVKRTVVDQIAMNFASGAQQPFLHTLNGIKRSALATDGLPQQITLKGFSAEGHDSANSDYAGHANERAGGLRDLNLLMERAKAYDARVGIHINATEAYPEARSYRPEILTGAGGWAWLDHSILIDKRKDVLSGRLYTDLEAMRKELPHLDFIYLDVYMDTGWPAWKLTSKLASQKLPLHTEYGGALDTWVTWSHWRSKSKVVQFLRFNDADIAEGDPLLRGGRNDKDGFMGWQNCHKFGDFVRGTFTRNLPAKYLKHFELLAWEPGKSAVFADGVRADKQGDTVRVTRDGKLIMTWKGNGDRPTQFVPWPPVKPEKIYGWDHAGEELTWDLPAAWKDLQQVHLYKLTDLGRTEEKAIPVTAGRVTVKLDKDTPYVMHPSRPAEHAPMNWGEGGFVQNPGFDAAAPDGWQISPGGAAVSIEKDKNENRYARIGGSATAVSLSQKLSGLTPGATYAATVWTQIKGARAATLSVTPDSGGVSAITIDRTDIRHSAPCDPRTGTNYRRLRTRFTMPAGATSATLALTAAPGSAATAVEFDDIRIVRTGISPEAAKHSFFEDFEHVESGGYGPFTGCPDEFTHLSEANPPHTKDVIGGKFSLKTRGKGFIARTLPETLPFAAGKLYRLSVDTLTDGKGGKGRLIFHTKGRRPVEIAIPEGRNTVTAEFSTGDTPDSYLALHKDGGDAVILDNLALDEIGAAKPATPEDIAAAAGGTDGAALIEEELFASKLSPAWKRLGTGKHKSDIAAGDGTLTIRAFTHTTAAVERALPAGVTEASCHLAIEADEAYTWGPGMALVWSDGRAISLNVRPGDKAFGVDATGTKQIKGGHIDAGVSVTLRIRLTADKILAEAMTNTDNDYQTIATLPRAGFTGAPAKIRLGKTHGVEALDDHTEPGPESTVRYDALRLLGERK